MVVVVATAMVLGNTVRAGRTAGLFGSVVRVDSIGSRRWRQRKQRAAWVANEIVRYVSKGSRCLKYPIQPPKAR